MGLLSVQSLISALALSCIVLTAIACTVLAIISGDNALDSTKGAGAEALRLSKETSDTALRDTRLTNGQAIDSCFTTSTSSILDLTTDFLTGAADLVSARLRSNLGTFMRLVGKQYDIHSRVVPPEKTDTAAYLDLQLPHLWGEHRAFSGMGVTGLSLFTVNNKFRTLLEETGTVNNPPDGLHHIQIMMSNGVRGTTQIGTAYPTGLNYTLDPVWDGPVRLPGGRFESDSCRAVHGQDISPVTGKPCKFHGMRGCRMGRYRETGGVIDDGACYYRWEARDQEAVILANVFFPINQPRFTPLLAIDGYLGFGLMSTWADSLGRKLGIVLVGIDGRSISIVLSNITIGGPSARFRIFITVEDNWLARRLPLPSLDQRDHLVGVSHGNTSSFYWKSQGPFTDASGTYDKGYWAQNPRHVKLASDPLIRGAARHILTNVDGGFPALAGQLVSFRMNSSLTGGGWTEQVPGSVQAYPWGANDFGPAQNISMPYLNGFQDESQSTSDPLPGYVRDGEMYFCSVTRLRSDLSGRPAVGQSDEENGQTEWIMTMIIDREYVLGATDRKQQQTRVEIEEANRRVTAQVDVAERKLQEQIQQSNEEVQEELDQDRLVLYCVIAAVGVVLMLLSCFFAFRIVAPIRELEAEMALVATMKLDIDENKPLSGLQEVREMQRSFLRMVGNLREYRSYMPASCLVDDTDDDDGETGAVSGGQTSNDVVTSKESGAEDPQPTKGRRLSASLPNTGSKGSRSVMSSGKQSEAVDKARAVLGIGLAKKQAAFMSVNVIDFCQMSKVTTPAALVEAHQGFLNALLAVTKTMKGIPDLFIGDRYYASFNAVRPCIQNKVQAAKCSLDSQKAAEEAINAGKPAECAAVSVACTAGPVSCGNIGVDGMKKFCAIGLPNSLVHVAEKLNETYKTAVLADAKIKADAENSMLMRLMHILPKYKGQVTRVYEIMGNKTMKEDEWMYQLEDAEKSDPTRTFSAAVERVFEGKIQEACQLLRDDAHQTPQHEIMFSLWCGRAD
eukprot:TRINITY_DN428_c0_g1_i1.p1 TRINITY_DN428_c0_g1~~TRINITY_DN428_c0_g1_i1.p1  ORF type:complete len:1053 (+),score=261.23 TRINITY_DN428_c0_g1_i1:113-3160(+)